MLMMYVFMMTSEPEVSHILGCRPLATIFMIICMDVKIQDVNYECMNV
jgi:hypothetical protein